MTAVIVYDSASVTTEKIARSVGSALDDNVRVLNASQVSPAELASVDFVVIGSPTCEGMPAPAVLDFLHTVSEPAADGLSAKFTGILVGVPKAIGRAVWVFFRSLLVGSSEIAPQRGETVRAAGWTRGINK